MIENVRELVMTCDICQSYPTAQQPLSFQCHDLTERPWQRMGTDLFSIKGKHCLATVDYMPNDVEMDQLYSTITAAVRANQLVHFDLYLSRFAIRKYCTTSKGGDKVFLIYKGVSRQTEGGYHLTRNISMLLT